MDIYAAVVGVTTCGVAFWARRTDCADVRLLARHSCDVEDPRRLFNTTHTPELTLNPALSVTPDTPQARPIAASSCLPIAHAHKVGHVRREKRVSQSWFQLSSSLGSHELPRNQRLPAKTMVAYQLAPNRSLETYLGLTPTCSPAYFTPPPSSSSSSSQAMHLQHVTWTKPDHVPDCCTRPLTRPVMMQTVFLKSTHFTQLEGTGKELDHQFVIQRMCVVTKYT